MIYIICPLQSVQHDGVLYSPGDVFPGEGEALTRLLQLGCVEGVGDEDSDGPPLETIFAGVAIQAESSPPPPEKTSRKK